VYLYIPLSDEYKGLQQTLRYTNFSTADINRHLSEDVTELQPVRQSITNKRDSLLHQRLIKYVSTEFYCHKTIQQPRFPGFLPPQVSILSQKPDARCNRKKCYRNQEVTQIQGSYSLSQAFSTLFSLTIV
jgi:hypothetical protein